MKMALRWPTAISPDDIHFGDDRTSDPVGLGEILMVVGWFVVLGAALWVTSALRLSYRQSLKLWGACNVVPVVWLILFRPIHVSTLFGLAVIVGFSWAMGRAAFDGRERERLLVQKLVDAGDVPLNERSKP